MICTHKNLCKISKKFLKSFSQKLNSERYVKIESFYEFMDENIKATGKIYENKIVDDEEILISLVKCPMTGSKLEKSEEGLKIAVKIFLI